MKNIIGEHIDSIKNQLAEINMPTYRAKQNWSWIYQKGVTSFAEMSNINKKDQALLSEIWAIQRPKMSNAQSSKDGTQKWLLKLDDKNEVEVVHIPEEDRGTLCVSSQIGCTLTCSFCHTGTQTLVRNLRADEIIGQYMLARDVFHEWGATVTKRHISNMVFMGMGEPLYNYDNVVQAIRCIMDSEGLALSRKRITLSTSGVVSMMYRCGEELGVNLAVSLHAVTNELRNTLVPLNKKYPLEELMNACRNYPALQPGRRITFEYVMLKGVNDSDADARALVKLIKGIPSKINLIPFNSWPGSAYECSSEKRIQAFGDIIYKAGYPCPVRRSRGDDILAACGQLKSESQRVRKSLNYNTKEKTACAS